MATKVMRTFSGIFSQAIVVGLLALFILIALVAMFTTNGMPEEANWIGMNAQSLGVERAAKLGIPNDKSGVVVGEVEGIAKRAGVLTGDVLVGINGSPVRDMIDFVDLTSRTDLSKGSVQLDIIRGGMRMPVLIQAQMPGVPIQPQVALNPGMMGISRKWLGIEAEMFSIKKGRAMGIPIGIGGVLIDGVGRGSLAEQAGLAANDVIVSVNGRQIGTTTELWNILASINDGRVEFGVYRRGQLMSAVLPMTQMNTNGQIPMRIDGR